MFSARLNFRANRFALKKLSVDKRSEMFTIIKLRVKIAAPLRFTSTSRKVKKMIRCPACGTDNLDNSQYCDQCGTALSPKKAEYKFSSPEFAPQVLEVPNFQQASVTSVGIPIVVDEINGNVSGEIENRDLPKNIHATLLIERGTSIGTEFQLSAEESYIGRWDADNGIFPDVDLDTHDPEAKVSRRHARIICENAGYAIEDLGSTNGTFVNRGRRLIPGTRQSLNDGDEIIVGKTFLRFHKV